MTDDALTLDDLPRDLIASGPERRADVACDLFAAGHSFEQIDAAMALHHAIDQALAEHIRNEIPHLRALAPEDACRHLIADIEQVRHALVGDA
jgi:hypothetical protein